MKKISFKAHIYIGFSLLIGILCISLFYILYQFRYIDISHQILDNIKITILITASLTSAVICWLLVYATKTFERQKKTALLIRETNSNLAKLSEEKELDNWILSGLANLDEKTRGGLSEQEIATITIQEICKYLNAKIGVIYLKSRADENTFVRMGSYAADVQSLRPSIESGQGLAGECIASGETIVLSEIPKNYLTVTSSLGNSKPEYLVIQPLVYKNEAVGVMELGFFRKIDDTILRFLEKAAVNLATATEVAIAHATLTLLYEETQQQAEELEAQQEELRTTNDELIHKTHQLAASEEELRIQQDELRHTNLELQEKARLLEERNFSIEQARQSIAMKANELEQSGKYKSEFLANMSHELRTPLNSILILAKLLEDNKPGNLLPDQLKYASVIHNAGKDLLHLINNILDLSKIESGSMELVIEDTMLSSIAQDLLDLFNGVANGKSIDFKVVVDSTLPPIIATDEQRLRQILKNLLSNAFKFTKENGKVELMFTRGANDTLVLSVKDTGIGIPESKQQLIFEAFKQADGSTNRKFGGTGLGLSICRELATMLGGEIQLESREGAGSTFTLILPMQFKAEAASAVVTDYTGSPTVTVPEQEMPTGPQVPPQSANTGNPKRLLIIEDDQNFAEILENCAHEHGFETLVAHQGDTGLQMAVEHLPDAIILDLVLPAMDGWTVLKKLKLNPGTENIPVHLMSADRPNRRKIKEAAVGFLKKPVDKKSLDDVFEHLHKMTESPLRTVLVVEDQKIQSDSLKTSLEESGVDVIQAFTGSQAIQFLTSGEHFDCIILDINLPDKSGADLLDEIKGIPQYADTPVIINTAMDLNAEMTDRMLHHTKTLVMKSDKSNSRILDEVNLFINRIKNGTPAAHSFPWLGGSLSKKQPLDNALEGKRILLADDDMRNIFALSTVFESYNLIVETANNGTEALSILQQKPGIDLVLMDIMMPGMDGYEAIAKIRTHKKFAKLPIIALTAKAMPDDRRLALEAGANDYITKPVDVNKLLSLIRVWIS
ncbi:response regulator [Parapedobacter defluvii]|uniref:hybrid sensor histidine kinase/response regulator n=1 Tax=Parapedobacter defluvii TaxID=2045106 RepID=UPI003341BC9E